MSNDIILDDNRVPRRRDHDTLVLKHVLDHGFVRLVSYMQPVPEEFEFNTDTLLDIEGRVQGDWTGDLEIIRNARVSYNADWRTGDDEGKDSRLVEYMLKNHHSSPFESMSFTFEVKIPIFGLRQWHRHRTWKYNEVSARYSEMDDEFYVPTAGFYGTQSKQNKQMREIASVAFGVSSEQAALELRWECEQRQMMWTAFQMYKRHIAEGMPRELARIILPFATYSRMFATVDLHNLFHFLRLRLHAHAQYEIRVYAQALLELITPICPVAVNAFKETLNVQSAESSKNPTTNP